MKQSCKISKGRLKFVVAPSVLGNKKDGYADGR
jgi:hypothetical protein